MDSSGVSTTVHHRFAPEPHMTPADLLHGADAYVSKLSPAEVGSLYLKPYDRNRGNGSYFAQIFPLLNMLQAMDLPAGGSVLEVGCGPGWVTEILVGLGFNVEALEPSAAMLHVASQRVRAFIEHHRDLSPPAVRFHQETLEECTLPDAAVDGILMCESLHHIVDERRGLAQAFRMLKPWGILGICAEPNWNPGHPEQETYLRETMHRFGTLESPFTFEYLSDVLGDVGFTGLTRYHAVNALVPVSNEQRPVIQVVTSNAQSETNMTALKPGSSRLTTLDPGAPIAADIQIIGINQISEPVSVELTIRLINTGPTAWLARAPAHGWVSVALRQEPQPAMPAFEASPRYPLPRLLPPQSELTMSVKFRLPVESDKQPWYVDLVNEGNYWFSDRGVICPQVHVG